MPRHRVQTTQGATFDVDIDDEGRITDVVGDWPEPGAEFELADAVPAHAAPVGVPEHVTAHAASRGREVCFYDPVGCRTCYCDDGGHMRCVGMC